MDEYGIYAQVLYPNLLAFSHHAFTAVGRRLRARRDPAYNDFLVDFASVAPERFILLASLPFWDVDASIAEIERCAEKGFQGVLFIAKPYKLGLPPLSDEHWPPLFATLDELQLAGQLPHRVRRVLRGRLPRHAQPQGRPARLRQAQRRHLPQQRRGDRRGRA